MISNNILFNNKTEEEEDRDREKGLSKEENKGELSRNLSP